MLKTKIRRPYLSSKCTVCGNKKSKFVKRQEAKGFQFRYKNTIKWNSTVRIDFALSA